MSSQRERGNFLSKNFENLHAKIKMHMNMKQTNKKFSAVTPEIVMLTQIENTLNYLHLAEKCHTKVGC